MAFSTAFFVCTRGMLILSTAVVVPILLFNLSLDVSASRVTTLWTSFRSWLKPPFLYLLTNAIIIIIAACSRFHQTGFRDQKENTEAISSTSADVIVHQQVPIATEMPVEFVSAPDRKTDDDTTMATQVESAAAVLSEEEKEGEEKTSCVCDEDGPVIAKSLCQSPGKIDADAAVSYSPVDKPLVSSRFSHRRATKLHPEGGRALRVAKPKRHETLENTWKMITEGRSSGHLRKCETWENYGRQSKTKSSYYQKSETFKDKTNYLSPVAPARSPVKLREPSLSQDELNRRVEAFIKKFNEEMRLQRLESLKRYKEVMSTRK